MRLKLAEEKVLAGGHLTLVELQQLSRLDTGSLLSVASRIRDDGFGDDITYSRKVFIPLTELCRDVCHYCTFAKAPRKIKQPFMSVDQVLEIAIKGKEMGCNEALFTLGEKPELRYSAARNWLEQNGYSSTVDYLVHVAGAVLETTGLLPHINAGTLEKEELLRLREVSASMGIMLETSANRLSEKGMPHYGSPDKEPAKRLETIRLAGELNIPMTSGVLIGIGETLEEYLQSLIDLRELGQRYGHIQEIIVQNFRAKPDTKMANHPEPMEEEILRKISLARLALGPAISIQTPPNLNPLLISRLIDAGINDWGGVSPVTVDHVNPEAPWPHINDLADQTKEAGKRLLQRLTIYPDYIADRLKWLDHKVSRHVLQLSDASGLARECDWRVGESDPPSSEISDELAAFPKSPKNGSKISDILARGMDGERLDTQEITSLFDARGSEIAEVCHAADMVRQRTVGNTVSYVVTRNINYTNVCTYKCGFCAFSKGKTHENLRGKPYDLDLDEIARRTREAWSRGATEVCLQGGIHPNYTGQTYLDICQTVKDACSEMHIHAFSPLEVTHGASTLGISIQEFLLRLEDAGLSTLPGTAAEILDDDVRAILCPDKLSADEWLNVLETAHSIGLKTTATIMFGHVEQPVHWARHLLKLRDLQERTGGITELVPLPFVAKEAPIFLRGNSRPGPTYREAVLMHAVSRIVLHPLITNIQVSWVKMGPIGVQQCLQAGVNDLGGTLMNESITRAAGAIHGQEAAPETLENWIEETGKTSLQRTTAYGIPPKSQQKASYSAATLEQVVNTPLKKVKSRAKTSKTEA